MRRRRDEILREIDAAESRIGEIDEIFCQPGYFERTDPAEVRELEAERERLRAEVERLVAGWEELEEELAGLQ